jgi:hypothetical protein
MRNVCVAGIFLLAVIAYSPANAFSWASANSEARAEQQTSHVSRAARPERHIMNYAGEIVEHPAGCPRSLFCGCGASVHVFGHPVRSLYLVSNWYQFPRTAPAPGMAVLFGRQHVAIIEEYHADNTATLYDANSGGGLTRVHRVKIAGLTVVDPHGR